MSIRTFFTTLSKYAFPALAIALLIAAIYTLSGCEGSVSPVHLSKNLTIHDVEVRKIELMRERT